MSFIGPIMFSLMGAAFIIRSAALTERFLRTLGVQSCSSGYSRRRLYIRLWFIFFGALCVGIGTLKIWLALS
jgi:hypothetical protein